MSAALVLPDLRTPEAFVAWAETQVEKYEMLHGRLVMMGGATNPHVTIAGNVFASLRSRLRGGPCRPFNGDFMVQASPFNRFYPDVTVACDEARDYTDRPVLVVEVLSPSTRRFDLDVKLPLYLRLPGLRHILYLDQDQPRAMLWSQGVEGEQPEVVSGLEATVPLASLGIELAMGDVYEDVVVGS